MKRSYLTLLSLAGALTPALLHANSVQVDQGPYQFSDAGELVTITSPDNMLAGYASVAQYNGGFATFAADSDIAVTYGTPYSFTLSQTDSDGKTLTQGAALLYYDFSKGVLPGYYYGTDAYAHIQDAGLLQAAIWTLEGYSAPGAQYPNGGAGNPYYDYALSVDPNAYAANNGLYDVDIMQLNDANGPAQNLLVVGVPDSTTTFALLGGGLGALALAGRKLRRTA